MTNNTTTIQNGYKETELGLLPEEWDSVKLSDVVDKTSQLKNINDSNRVIRYIDVSSIDNQNCKITNYSKHKVKEAPSRARKIVKSDDVIFATVRPYLKRIAIVPAGFDEEICSTAFCVLRARKNVIDPLYLYYSVCDETFVKRVSEYQRGSSYPAITDTVIKNESIPLPPLPEQRAIAYVLRTVQEAKEKTEKVIEAARELKKSLMHHLFTFGPVPFHDADKVKLKETEVGKFPCHWNVKKLGEISSILAGGTPSRSNPKYWGGNIPWVKTGEIKYNLITDTEEKISNEGLDNSSARMVPAGTLLIAMYGQGITRGRVAILGIDSAINQACAAIFVDEQLNKNYLFYYLSYSYDRIRNFGHGAHQKNLSSTLLKLIEIPFPDLAEQKEIVKILKHIDRKIFIEEYNKKYLETLFSSMLNHLMTAKIRVNNINIPELTAEVA